MPTLSAADDHVSPQGDDAGPGGQPRLWRSIERANRLHVRPGDRILFEAGAVFTGNLVLSGEDDGTPAQPVTIGSYGNGCARIDAGAGSAMLADGASAHERPERVRRLPMRPGTLTPTGRT